jgi:hypothetical protein
MLGSDAKEVGVERPLASYRGSTVAVVVLGSPEACWRCGAITTNVVGVTPAGSTSPYDLLPFTDDQVKELVVAVLDEMSRRRAGVGQIRQRRSKTTGSAYISNGCRRCDALQGDHFIAESIAAIDATTMMDLVPVTETELEASSWTELSEACMDG